MNLEQKLEKLKEYINHSEKLAIAFSAGVDSAFLLKAAKEVLGENVLAVTVNSSLLPGRELKEAVDFCIKENINHEIINFNPFENEAIIKNLPDRCYHCKKEIIKKIKAAAKNFEIKDIADGSNADDENDYRPGAEALKEEGIISPLKEANLSKSEIRKLSRIYNIKTYNKPSFACLASRFAYGEEITPEKIIAIEAAENFLFDEGFSQFRVRIHGNLARIEVLPEEFEKLINIKEKTVLKFKTYGFTYITADFAGYRTGSMNEVFRQM